MNKLHTLKELRNKFGFTQVDLSANAGMTQGDYSRVERRNDWLVSTLIRVAGALGGHLEIALVKDGERYPINFDGD